LTSKESPATTATDEECEVFIASDGEPAIRLSAKGHVAALERALASARAEIQGYRATQDELQDQLARAEADVNQLRDVLGEVTG